MNKLELVSFKQDNFTQLPSFVYHREIDRLVGVEVHWLENDTTAKIPAFPITDYFIHLNDRLIPFPLKDSLNKENIPVVSISNLDTNDISVKQLTLTNIMNLINEAENVEVSITAERIDSPNTIERRRISHSNNTPFSVCSFTYDGIDPKAISITQTQDNATNLTLESGTIKFLNAKNPLNYIINPLQRIQHILTPGKNGLYKQEFKIPVLVQTGIMGGYTEYLVVISII